MNNKQLLAQNKKLSSELNEALKVIADGKETIKSQGQSMGELDFRCVNQMIKIRELEEKLSEQSEIIKAFTKIINK